MLWQEKLKNLYVKGEFESAYNLTKDEKLKDLLILIDKSGGIEHLPLGIVYSIVLENSYLYNLLKEEGD